MNIWFHFGHQILLHPAHWTFNTQLVAMGRYTCTQRIIIDVHSYRHTQTWMHTTLRGDFASSTQFDIGAASITFIRSQQYVSIQLSELICRSGRALTDHGAATRGMAEISSYKSDDPSLIPLTNDIVNFPLPTAHWFRYMVFWSM